MAELKLIENFIFNDKVQDILSKINDNMMDFNILEITGMGEYEIRHSNILAWVFGANEHNLEYEILDSFLKKVIENSLDENKKDKLKHYLYLQNQKRDITIYREKDNIDLLIVDEENKKIFVIENKVNAYERVDGEDGGQLQKYENIVNAKYDKSYEKYFIFLTKDSQKPSKDYWLVASYQMIADVIENILKTKELTQKTKIVLENYVDLLKRRGIVADKKLEELCRQIWANEEYREAIDILLEYRTTRLNAIFQEIQKKYDFNERYSNLPLNSIQKMYERFNLDWENSEEIFELQIVYRGGKNEYIWIGYWYPELLSFDDKKLIKICEKITKINKQETKILLINKEYIKNKTNDEIIKYILDEIEKVDKKIMNILNATK
jgi:hypothetical protein